MSASARFYCGDGGVRRIRATGGSWVYALLAIILLAQATSFTFVNTQSFLDFAINADTLYPALLAEELRADVTTVLRFQPARIPSFVPDLLIAVGADLATGSWRLAFWAYAAAAFVMLSLLGGYIASRLRGQRFWACALGLAMAMAGLLELGLLHFVATAGDHAPEVFDDRLVVNLHVLLMMPAWHSGAFIAGLAVVALAWTSGRAVSPGRAGGLLLLTSLATASNALVIVYAVLPAAMALAEGTMRRRIAGPPAMLSIAALAGGTGAGHALGWLSARRALPVPAFDAMADNAYRAIAGLPGQTVMLLTLAASLPVVLAFLAERRIGKLLTEITHKAALRYFVMVAAGACVAGIVVTLPLYVSNTGMNWRYAAPVAWWPLILAIGICGPWLSRRMAHVATWATLISAGLIGLSAIAGGSASPAILRWRHPALVCLDRADPAVALRAGFASYWHGRTIAAASNWRRQVESTDFGAGRPILWMDDPRSWVQQRHGPAGVAPPFRFIVLWRHDPEALRRIHGKPAQIVPCGGTEIWVYPASWNPLDQLIAMADELVPQALAVGRRVCLPDGRPGSDGRELTLPAGEWRIRLHYRLTGDAVRRWTLRAAPGLAPIPDAVLMPGDGVAEVIIKGPIRLLPDSFPPAPVGQLLTIKGVSIAPSAPHPDRRYTACDFEADPGG